VDLRNIPALRCPADDGEEYTQNSAVAAPAADILDGYNLSRLPVISAVDRFDLLAEVVYVGKAVMKDMWVSSPFAL